MQGTTQYCSLVFLCVFPFPLCLLKCPLSVCVCGCVCVHRFCPASLINLYPLPSIGSSPLPVFTPAFDQLVPFSISTTRCPIVVSATLVETSFKPLELCYLFLCVWFLFCSVFPLYSGSFLRCLPACLPLQAAHGIHRPSSPSHYQPYPSINPLNLTLPPVSVSCAWVHLVKPQQTV